MQFILASVGAAAEQRQIAVYQTSGKLVTPASALKQPLLAAASNWHVLSQFALRYAGPSLSLLIDMGTTTTDIIPLVNGQVAAVGKTDVERLQHGELMYAGVERTPLCALPLRSLS